MMNETLLSVDIGMSGVRAVRVMAYSPTVEEAADKLYQAIKKNIDDIDQVLSKPAEAAHQGNSRG